MYICIFVFICMFICIYVNVYLCIYICINKNVCIYVHIYTHTHMYFTATRLPTHLPTYLPTCLLIPIQLAYAPTLIPSYPHTLIPSYHLPTTYHLPTLPYSIPNPPNPPFKSTYLQVPKQRCAPHHPSCLRSCLYLSSKQKEKRKEGKKEKNKQTNENSHPYVLPRFNPYQFHFHFQCSTMYLPILHVYLSDRESSRVQVHDRHKISKIRGSKFRVRVSRDKTSRRREKARV